MALSIKVGYIRNRYPEIRNIIKKVEDSVEYLHIGKWRNYLHVGLRLIDRISSRYLHLGQVKGFSYDAIYQPVIQPKVDIIHTFNAVCDTSIPWVCTFETSVPRTNQVCCRDWEYRKMKADKLTARGYSLLASDSCCALIALSEANKKIQMLMMEAFDIKERELIEKKIIVLPPPQPLLISQSEFESKFADLTNGIEIVFVAGLFFRKGGAQIIDVLQEYVNQGVKLHLTVVSSMALDDLSKATPSDLNRYEQLIEKSDWITHYRSLPNQEVLQLCKKAHVGLLPSMADTYGYSVLEMQACGCPVITTDIRALAEINNDDCGFVIKVPKQPSTEAKYDTAEDHQILKKKIENGLRHAFSSVFESPDILKGKAQKAMERIVREHSPEMFAQRLDAIYKNAIEKKVMVQCDGRS